MVCFLLHQIFAIFAVVVRYELENAKFFNQEIAKTSLAKLLTLLSCFTSETQFKTINRDPQHEFLYQLHISFSTYLPHSTTSSSLPHRLEACCLILWPLNNLAIDSFKLELGLKKQHHQ